MDSIRTSNKAIVGYCHSVCSGSVKVYIQRSKSSCQSILQELANSVTVWRLRAQCGPFEATGKGFGLLKLAYSMQQVQQGFMLSSESYG